MRTRNGYGIHWVMKIIRGYVTRLDMPCRANPHDALYTHLYKLSTTSGFLSVPLSPPHRCPRQQLSTPVALTTATSILPTPSILCSRSISSTEDKITVMALFLVPFLGVAFGFLFFSMRGRLLESLRFTMMRGSNLRRQREINLSYESYP